MTIGEEAYNAVKNPMSVKTFEEAWNTYSEDPQSQSLTAWPLYQGKIKMLARLHPEFFDMSYAEIDCAYMRTITLSMAEHFRWKKPTTEILINIVSGTIRFVHEKKGWPLPAGVPKFDRLRGVKFPWVKRPAFVAEIKYDKKGYRISHEEEARLLAALPEEHRDQVWFCLNTGFRKEKAWGLKRGWIDLEEGLIKIERKTSNPDPDDPFGAAFAIDPVVMDMLRKLCFNKGSEDYVFDTHKPPHHRVWKRAVAAAGMPERVRIHDTRHTFCSRLGSCPGMSPFHAMKLMGHSDLKQTQHYFHTSIEEQRAAVIEALEYHRELARPKLELVESE